MSSQSQQYYQSIHPQTRSNGYNVARRSSLASVDDGLSSQGSPLSRSLSNNQGWGIWNTGGLSSNVSTIKGPLGDDNVPLAKSPSSFDTQTSPKLFPQDAWKTSWETSFTDRRNSSVTEPIYMRSGSLGGFSSNNRLDDFYSDKSPPFRAIHSNGELSELPTAFRNQSQLQLSSQNHLEPRMFGRAKQSPAVGQSQQVASVGSGNPLQQSIVPGAGSPSLNLLERFSQLADATREAELLGGMKQLNVDDSIHSHSMQQQSQRSNIYSQYQQQIQSQSSSYLVSPARSDVGSPTDTLAKLSRSETLSPYASPTPPFVPLTNGYADVNRSDSQRLSRSSSISSSVWQQQQHHHHQQHQQQHQQQHHHQKHQQQQSVTSEEFSSLEGQSSSNSPYIYNPQEPTFVPYSTPDVFFADYSEYPSNSNNSSNNSGYQFSARQNMNNVSAVDMKPPLGRSNSRNSNQGALSNNNGTLRQQMIHSKLQQGASRRNFDSATSTANNYNNSPNNTTNNSNNHANIRPDVEHTIKGSTGSGNSHVGGSRKSGGNSDFSNIRSPLLEEFRSNKNKKYELKDLYGHIVEFSGDQHGSRFIQQRLETASSEEKEIIFNEIQSNSLQLMTDVFGNYVIQKFFELGNQLQKMSLAKQMETHILSLSLQMYGCRVVQKAIEHVLTDQQAILIKELEGHVLKCVKDQNGNHVVQKAIERIPSQYIEFIIDAFFDQVYQLAIHPYGCRVIQRMLEYCPEDAQIRLLNELHGYTYYLVEDQYGNYVIQHVVERGRAQDKNKIVEIVKDSVLAFSRHKFASNVVEKCITYGTPQQRADLIHEIVTPRSDGTIPLTIMMKDQYANYVIQKLLETSQGEVYDELVNNIRPHLHALKKYTYGKHLVSIEKLLSLSERSDHSRKLEIE